MYWEDPDYKKKILTVNEYMCDCIHKYTRNRLRFPGRKCTTHHVNVYHNNFWIHHRTSLMMIEMIGPDIATVDEVKKLIWNLSMCGRITRRGYCQSAVSQSDLNECDIIEGDKKLMGLG